MHERKTQIFDIINIMNNVTIYENLFALYV